MPLCAYGITKRMGNQHKCNRVFFTFPFINWILWFSFWKAYFRTNVDVFWLRLVAHWTVQWIQISPHYMISVFTISICTAIYHCLTLNLWRKNQKKYSVSIVVIINRYQNKDLTDYLHCTVTMDEYLSGLLIVLPNREKFYRYFFLYLNVVIFAILFRQRVFNSHAHKTGKKRAPSTKRQICINMANERGEIYTYGDDVRDAYRAASYLCVFKSCVL